MSGPIVSESAGLKSKTLVRNSESYKDLASEQSGTNQNIKDARSDSLDQAQRMAILAFSKNDLLQLLGLLEAELEARELVITSLKTEREKILKPSSNHHKHYTLHDPYAALSRDDANKTPPGEDRKNNINSDPVAILQLMVERHKEAEGQMKKQLEDMSTNHNKVLKELALERQKHAQETAHGDDVTYFLEKDRERLSQQVDFEKAQQKKMERETKRAQTVLIEERKKHTSVVKALLDEHRYLQNELAEALQRLEQADCEAQACKVDLGKTLGRLSDQRQRAEKREAEIERQISEFDIEREQLVGRLKREESRTKQLQATLEDAHTRIGELEHVLELSKEFQREDIPEDAVPRTRSMVIKPSSEWSGEHAVLPHRPKSSTLPATTAAGHLNLARSSKLFAPRGFRSPLKTEKSESSSGSSEELSSPNMQRINTKAKNRSSGEYHTQKGSSESLEKSSGDETVIDGGKSASVSIKPKVASVTPSRRDTVRKGPSPASSTDKLASRERSSTPTDLTKISKIPAMTKKVVTVGVVSPQQTRRAVETAGDTTEPVKRVEVILSKDGKDLKPIIAKPAHLSRDPPHVDTTIEVSSSKQNDSSPQMTSPPGRPILPYTTFSGVNVKAKAAQLISPGAKRNSASSPQSAAGLRSASPVGGRRSPSGQVNGNATPGNPRSSDPPGGGVQGTKRPSPRGTPPPVPSKPTLIPQQKCTLPPTTASTTTSPPMAPSSGAKHGAPSPPIKRHDSLVEARKLFYANKHMNSDNASVQARNTHNINSNNSNNYGSDVLEIGPPPTSLLDHFPTAPSPVKVGSSCKMESAPSDSCCSLADSHAVAMLPCQSFVAPNAVWHCMFSAQGDNSWIATPSPCLFNWTLPLHQAALRGDSATICRLIEEDYDPNDCDKDGSTPLYVAALIGSEECLELLLNLGGKCAMQEQHGFTPLHAAAHEGHDKCCKLLIDHGAEVNSPDAQDWLPVHWAVVKGHADCVRILSDNGADLGCTTKTGWTVLHVAARFGQNECMKCLLDLLKEETVGSRDSNQNPLTKNQLEALVTIADGDSWTVAHLLASAGNRQGLKILRDAGCLRLSSRDRWNQTPLDVAAGSCRDYLNSLVGINVPVTIDLTTPPPKMDTLIQGKPYRTTDKRHYTIGCISVGPTMDWEGFHSGVCRLLTSHCQFLNSIDRLESSPDKADETHRSPPTDLGISRRSIHHLKCGSTEWPLGECPSIPLSDLFKSSPEVTVKLKDASMGCLDHISYDTLIPMETLQNYLRLIEQYKRLIFYGPIGCRKTSLILKLAEVVKARLMANGHQADISFIPLNPTVTHQEFIKLLLSKGFLVPTTPLTFQAKPSCTPVLLLDGLEKVTMSEVFGDLLLSLERPGSPMYIRVPNCNGSYTLNRECIIMGAMDRARPSVDLSLQQHLRWIQLHWEHEPVISLLARQLLRKLSDKQRNSAIEDGSLEPVIWVCQAWHSFNESLGRLGLPDLVMGPKKFYACPFGSEMVEAIRRWMCLLWNHSLAPLVEDAVHRGSMRSATDVPSKERDKVANTALYVLLQKAFFPGCPIADDEKEDYFSSFRGVNATLSQLNSAASHRARKPRRSRSMDRNRTSNKAAVMAKRQMLQEYAGTESNGSRSFIPRRIGTMFSRAGVIPPPVAEKPCRSPLGSQPTATIPGEERDLLESLLNINQSESGIEELIQLQERIFGQNNNRTTPSPQNGASLNGARFSDRGRTHSNGLVEGAQQAEREHISRPMPHGTPTKTNKKSALTEEPVWSVWEETV